MADVKDEAEKGKTYYLKPGFEHNTIESGEQVLRKGDNGDSVVLTAGQVGVFQDKFFPLGQKGAPVEAPEAPAEVKSVPVDPAPAAK
jgi:hypothetical protein